MAGSGTELRVERSGWSVGGRLIGASVFSAGPGSELRLLAGQALRYGLVGVANTIVGLGTILALQGLAGWGPFAANAGGYATGLATSFLLNRAWTFGARDRAGRRLLHFLLAFGAAYTANLLVLALLLNPLGHLVAQLVAMATYTVLFFILCRRMVFA